MADITQTISGQIEVVAPKLEKYFESTNQIAGLIKKSGRVQKVSSYLYRIPFQRWRGGTFGKYVADGGDMGSGTGMSVKHLTAGYFYSKRSYRITQEQIDTSQDTGQSVVNVFQKTLAEAMTEAQVDDDIAFHGDGTGKLTNAASAHGTTTTYTFAGTTDTLGVGKLRPGMVVDQWSSNGVTKRVDGSGAAGFQITNIDNVNKIVTVDRAVASGDSDGILALYGMDAYGPSALTSYAAAWPTAPGSRTANTGLGGDSFRHGLYYANDPTTSNYYLGLLKSTYSELLPVRVNAASSGLVFAHGLLALDGLIQKRDPEIVQGLIGIAHMAQRSAVFDQGVAISNWFRGASDKMIDVMPNNVKYADTFEFCGIPCHLSKRQDRSRVDFINPANWGRAQLFDTKFYEVDGTRVFPVRSATTANLVSAVEFHIVQAYDFVCYDPGAGAIIDTLTLPSGY